MRIRTDPGFESDLRAYCDSESGPYLRPFGANASWRSARVVIIGENPATPLRAEFHCFDDYWRALTEFPNEFDAVYRNHRGGAPSKTSRRVQDLCAPIGADQCLITNICWFPAPKPRAIPVGEYDRHLPFLRRLIDFISPSAVLAHGKSAVEFVEKTFAVQLDRYAPVESQGLVVRGTLLLAYPHLSGLGIQRGKKFRPDEDLPVFARSIRAHLSVAS